MQIIGLDLHKCESQRCFKPDDGSITDRRIATSRERFTALFGERPPARILLEASTESEWMARHLESLFHEVIVADPNDAPKFANHCARESAGASRRGIPPLLAGGLPPSGGPRGGQAVWSPHASRSRERSCACAGGGRRSICRPTTGVRSTAMCSTKSRRSFNGRLPP